MSEVVSQPHDKNPPCLLSVTARGSLARLTAVDNRGSAESLRSSTAEAAGLLGWRMGELCPDKKLVKSDTVRTTLSAFWTVAPCRKTSPVRPRSRGANQCLHFRQQCGQVESDWGGDNEGAYLDFVGEFKQGQMILEREAIGKDGKEIPAAYGWEKYCRFRVRLEWGVLTGWR